MMIVFARNWMLKEMKESIQMMTLMTGTMTLMMNFKNAVNVMDTMLVLILVAQSKPVLVTCYNTLYERWQKKFKVFVHELRYETRTFRPVFAASE
jgi:hypothetical protein